MDKCTDKVLHADCCSCPLAEKQEVRGYGPPPAEAKAVLVGEAPGHNEVVQGRPFVGQSGKLLRAILQQVGVDPDDLYMTNVVLCRPPGNRIKRVPKAVECCRERLAEELRPYAKADVPIIAMGRTAQDVLIGRPIEKSLRGKWWRGNRILATWHPAYVLRSPSHLMDLVIDLRKINNGGRYEVAPINYEVIDDVATLKDRVDELIELKRDGADFFAAEDDVVCIDLECDQVDWTADQILSVGVAWTSTDAFVIADNIVYESETRDQLVRIFDHFNVVGHNFKFDSRFLLHQLGVHNAYAKYDSLIAHYVLDENSYHGLKGLLQDYFDIDDYEQGLVQRYLSSRNDRYGKVPRPQLYEYNALDVCYNLLLWHQLKRELEENDMYERPFMFPLMASQKPLTTMELNGIPVDMKALKDLSARLHTELGRRYQELAQTAEREFNPNSWQQVGAIMYDHFSMPKVRGRGFKRGSTCKAARAKLMERLPEDSAGYKWLELYGEWKKLEKARSSYVDNMYDNIDKDGYVHPDFLVYGSEVGRLSARDPAIQTIPRASSTDVGEVSWGAHIRGIFGGVQDKVIMEVDYSQAEMRVAACLSRDEFLLKVYRDGRDLHSEVAIAMYGENFTKEQRVHCKMFNFSYLYGGTEHSFATDSGLPISVARDFVRRYNNVMSGLAEFRQQQLQTLREQGYVESPFGRRRRFPMITRINADDARKSSVHAPVAGTASDLTLISLIRTQEWIDEQGLEDVKQVITVHDSNILIAPKDMQEWVGRNVQRIMVETASEFFPEIPWKVDVEAGPDWGHIKDIFK